MDSLDNEFLNLLNTFKALNVKYIVVGGFCTNFYGYNRTTGDIDFWIEDTIQSR